MLYVVLSHMGSAGFIFFELPHNAIGKVGVWIFFVLSAFLLTSRSLDALQRLGPSVDLWLSYLIHRVFRIYPLLIFAVLMHAIFGTFTHVQVIEHLLLLDGYAELWAIPVEFQYYLVIPLIVVGTWHLGIQSVSWLLVSGVALSTTWGMVYPLDVFSNSLALLPKLTPFLIGSLVALRVSAKPSGWPLQTKKSPWPYVSIAALAGATYAFSYVSSVWKPTQASSWSTWTSLLMSVAAVGVLYSSLRWQVLHFFFSSRVLVYLGEISFSLYLLHSFVIHLMLSVDVPVRTSLKPWLCLLAAITIAALTHRLIERPGLQLGKLLSQRLRVNPTCTTRKGVT